MTGPPSSSTYSSMVTRESVRIAFLIAGLNDLDVLACDIGNAYLNKPCREKVWFEAGAEFGSRKGRPVKVVRALYGLKTSGTSWRATLVATLTEMGFSLSKADADVWMRPATKPNGFEYYEYLLVYVDNVLAISHDPKPLIEEIGKMYELKKGSVGPPTRYLGATISKFHIPGDKTGREYWVMSAREYVQEAVRIVKDLHTLTTALGITKARAPGDGVPHFRISEQAREFEDCF